MRFPSFVRICGIWLSLLPYACMFATTRYFDRTTRDRQGQQCQCAIDRRAVIQFASSVPILSSTRNKTSDNRQSAPATFKVVVIGAGFSGLSVAYNLMKHFEKQQQEGLKKECLPFPNLDIDIIEGRDRIGGRVHPFDLENAGTNKSTTDSHTWVDLGGQWVHEASPQNPIRRLMENDLNLTFVGDDHGTEKSHRTMTNRFLKRKRENVLFDQGGTLMDRGVAQRAKRIFYKAMDDLVDDDLDLDDNGYLRKHRADRTGISYGELLDSRMEAEHPLKNRSWQQEPLNRAMNYFVHRSEENEGGKLSEVSAVLANNLYDDTAEGPDRVVEGSYKSILDALSEKLNIGKDHQSLRKTDPGCKVRLRLNSRVKQICYDNNDGKISTVLSNEGQGNDTYFDSTLDADVCVCTVPLGVLQRKMIDFVPPLPKERLEAIEGIGMGLLNKIVFRFDRVNGEKFWGDLHQFGICHEDPSRIKTFYDCSDDYYEGTNDSPAVLVQFLAGKVADRLDPPPSSTEVDGNTVPDHPRDVTDEEIIQESLDALRLVFGSDKVPDPAVAKVTRWREDQWSCGSFSFAKVGSSAKMYDEVASPLCDRLLFAGEHTSKRFHSTVHGAWETGEREAHRIWEMMHQEQVEHSNSGNSR